MTALFNAHQPTILRYTVPRMRPRWFAVLLVLIFETAFAASERTPELVLLTPQPDAVIRQNSDTSTEFSQSSADGTLRMKAQLSSINCPDGGTGERGFEIRFAWKPFPAAASYRLVVAHEGAQFPAIDRTLTEPYFDERACNVFVTVSNLANWHCESA